MYNFPSMSTPPLPPLLGALTSPTVTVNPPANEAPAVAAPADEAGEADEAPAATTVPETPNAPEPLRF